MQINKQFNLKKNVLNNFLLLIQDSFVLTEYTMYTMRWAKEKLKKC